MKKVADFKCLNISISRWGAVVGTRNQTVSLTILEECECIDKKGEVSSNSTISQLFDAQTA